jgi:hypothetical protein
LIPRRSLHSPVIEESHNCAMYPAIRRLGEIRLLSTLITTRGTRIYDIDFKGDSETSTLG